MDGALGFCVLSQKDSQNLAEVGLLIQHLHEGRGSDVVLLQVDPPPELIQKSSLIFNFVNFANFSDVEHLIPLAGLKKVLQEV